MSKTPDQQLDDKISAFLEKNLTIETINHPASFNADQYVEIELRIGNKVISSDDINIG